MNHQWSCGGIHLRLGTPRCEPDAACGVELLVHWLVRHNDATKASTLQHVVQGSGIGGLVVRKDNPLSFRVGVA